MPDDAPQFEDLGGAASMDPSAFARWISSRYFRHLANPDRLARQRAKVEAARRRAGRPHVVEYFHQIDDAYSQLAAQLLAPLEARYDIKLICHLVEGPSGRNAPEPSLLLTLAQLDAAAIAPHYGLAFPEHRTPPEPALVALAARLLAAADDSQFVHLAPLVGAALWSDDPSTGLQALAATHTLASHSDAETRVRSGNARRSALKHYSGAMFHYGREWYWGVDRLYHLERRLIDLGAGRTDDDTLLAPRPEIVSGPLKDNGSFTLEMYPSLRSPYTSIIFDRTVALAEETGVKLAVRPVLPMVMRGVPATREKGTYIFRDAAREAQSLGLEWGRIYDPIGEPVRRCYSLYPWAREQGRDVALLSAFLQAAFFEGINTNSDRGMRKVVDNAGLSWDTAKSIIGNRDWEDEIERNRTAMYDVGLWGVPSFRLLGPDREHVLALWGQDRLWLFAREIQRLLADRG